MDGKRSRREIAGKREALPFFAVKGIEQAPAKPNGHAVRTRKTHKPQFTLVRRINIGSRTELKEMVSDFMQNGIGETGS